ncbi:MAG: penicillin-binding transpeptidase domain-containing protein [Anaerolineaceae bacterium]|nr:penicillin-binding transpeptidase domain-containing protein [Anaerolineaceae bacterium]
MKLRNWILLLVFLLGACSRGAAVDEPGSPSSTADNLPPPPVRTTSVPTVKPVAQAFLDAWKAEDYQAMYNLLTPLSRDAITKEDFEAFYRNAAIKLSLRSLDYNILSTFTNPTTAQVAYRVNYETALLGNISRDNIIMNLKLEDGGWQVQWEEGLLLPELSGGNRLHLDIKIPARANIYDRTGQALVAQTDAVALGIIPANIEDGGEGQLLTELARLTGKTSQSIKILYDHIRGAPWYVPVGETTLQQVQERYQILSGLGGLVMNNFSARYYYDGGIAPHVTGYVSPIFKEELEEYQRRGYRGDEKVGRAGLERWGEDYLAGNRGASLYLVNSQGEIITRLAHSDTQPSQAIYTTIDAEFQKGVQRTIAGFRGAVVVLERDTGRVLSITSSPNYDPNLFEPSNYNRDYLLEELFDTREQRLVNRATQGGYPLGSVFKIITLAAALESGLYTAESTYDCAHTFTELPGQVFYDWTYEKELPPSGVLTLPEGLIRSCNPWFYHLGLSLFRQNQPKAISDMARAFGLGKPTGIGQVAEDAGALTDPVTEGDAVQMAIGQGTMLVTPLQVAAFIAAIGNGGTLHRPQVIEKIVSPLEDEVFTFQPQAQANLPLKAQTIKIIQDAMNEVVTNRRGTAVRTFIGMAIPIFGKTGTAQNPMGKPHSWFVGYTNSVREDKSNIAIVVIVENSGEGSEFAAPIFRRVVELYYDGRPGRLYPWEASFNVTITPTPLYTNTPIVQPTATPEPTPETVDFVNP